MIYPLIIVALILIVFCRTVNYGVTIDDSDVVRNTLKEKPQAKGIYQTLWWHLRGKHYTNVKLAHILVILIHTANCLLIYFAFGRNTVSFITAVLFASHPAATQGSVWISGKGYTIGTLWILLMWLFKWLTPVFYYLGFMWSFNVIAAPMIFLFTGFWFWIFLIPVMDVLRERLIKDQLTGKYTIATSIQKEFNRRKLILYFKTMGYYFCLAFFPLKLGVYHFYLYSYGLSDEDTKYWERRDKYFWLGILIVCGLIAGLIWNRCPAVFGLFWFVLFISQWCNIVMIQQAVAERYLYLPLIGLMFMLVNLIMYIPDYTTKVVVFSVIFTAYLVRLVLHIPSYKDLPDQTLHNLIAFPKHYAVYTWKGQVELNSGQFFTALETWFNGWKLRKNDFRLNNNIAALLLDLGKYDDAEAFINNAEESLLPEHKEKAKGHMKRMRLRLAEARAKEKK